MFYNKKFFYVLMFYNIQIIGMQKLPHLNSHHAYIIQQTSGAKLLEHKHKDEFPVLLVPDAVNYKEAREIKQLAQPLMERSQFIDEKDSKNRTSSTAFLNWQETKTIESIVKRAAQLVGYPPNHAEVQVVYYQKGQFVGPHYDTMPDDFVIKKGSQRNITYLIYLNSTSEFTDGQTIFPRIKLTVTPQTYAVLIWPNVEQNGSQDIFSLHAGKSVTKGEKWVMQILFHDKVPFMNKYLYSKAMIFANKDKRAKKFLYNLLKDGSYELLKYCY